MRNDTTRRRFVRGLGATGIAIGLAGCSSGSAESDGTPTEPDDSGGDSDGESWVRTDTVDMNDELGFDPVRVEVEVGTTVTWTNVGTIGHTVTAYDGEIPDGAAYFASGGFDDEAAAKEGYPDEGNVTEGGTYEHTFETKGEYEYYCIPHEMNGMIGTVRVI